jgi:hypothetical protein
MPSARQGAFDRQRLAELAQFIGERRRMPKAGAAGESELAKWVHGQVTPGTPGGGAARRSRDAALERLVKELDQFVSVHHRMPSGGKPEENSLYQRVLKNRGANDMRPELRAQLDELLEVAEEGSAALRARRGLPPPTRAEKQAEFNRQMLTEFEVFVGEHGRLPTHSRRRGEFELARWVDQVREYRPLSPGKMTRFDQVLTRTS